MRLYQVTTKHFVAGYVEDAEGNLIQCAPILLKKFSYWKTKAKEINMAKQYEITKIEYNQTIGKGNHKCAFLSTVGVESGAKRRDPVFENSKQFKVLQECAVGNIVELKIIKDGDYFNLAKDDDAIILVEKHKEPQNAVESGTYDKVEKATTKSYGGYKEDPNKQASIERQNALTNATNFVCASMTLGCGTEQNLIKTIISTAIQFAKYTSGEDMTEYLMEPAPWEEPKPEVKRGRKSKENLEPKSGRDIPKSEFGE